MLRHSRTLLSITALILFYAAPAKAADLKTLMEIGASQADIAKTLREETIIYDSVKSGIDSGAIKNGIAADTVRKKYGEPVIRVHDKKRNADKWLYMPAASTHFKGEKIFLYFDRENKLMEWEKVVQ